MRSPAPIAFALAALLAIVPRIQSTLQGTLQNTQQDASRATPDVDSKLRRDKRAIRVPLPKGKKLVLTDGTFQIVREYSVKDDRVRYWSVERSDWEEIPTESGGLGRDPQGRGRTGGAGCGTESKNPCVRGGRAHQGHQRGPQPRNQAGAVPAGWSRILRPRQQADLSK